MKLALLATSGLLLTISCSSLASPKREILMATSRVTVSGELARSERTWTLRSIVAEEPTGGNSALAELLVVAFADHDDDSEINESERRGSWHVDSSIGTSRLVASGMFGESALSPADFAALKLDVRVRFVGAAASSEEGATIAPFGS